MSALAGVLLAASWSGGKDSCLALWRAKQAGAKVHCLLNMLDENGERSRSHGVRPEVLTAQAEAMGLPLVSGKASWAAYEAEFVSRLRALHGEGVQAMVFGDIDLEPHREWEEKVCAAASLQALLPLWQEAREKLVREFVDAGFSARIVMLNTDMVSKKWLGQTLDHALIDAMLAEGVDPCAEGGEFHTLVTDGPLFAAPLRLRVGEERRDGCYASLDFMLS
ncbi:diphthine--ammonia ligase [uncultured Aquitalea sp.]|uniref:Dph6-related ATP pyrophosphatase n=1 Tax=uncultured Aquitalea sp. TaxID=540272 RepID=UPI0025EF991D|nr:diphthine--ammonia ligase [uncultured Aquitalea sp.]